MDARIGVVVLIGALFTIAGTIDVVRARVALRPWLALFLSRVTASAWYSAIVLTLISVLQWILRAMELLPPPRS